MSVNNATLGCVNCGASIDQLNPKANFGTHDVAECRACGWRDDYIFPEQRICRRCATWATIDYYDMNEPKFLYRSINCSWAGHTVDDYVTEQEWDEILEHDYRG